MTDLFSLSACNIGLGLAHLRLTSQMRCLHFYESVNSPLRTSPNTAVCFIKYSEDIPVGFAQCGLRSDYVEGTESSPVGYLEGVFVKEEYRHKGYGKEFLLACERWAKRMGCSEFVSDCELSNVNSLKFHLAMGFDEANRIFHTSHRM